MIVRGEWVWLFGPGGLRRGPTVARPISRQSKLSTIARRKRPPVIAVSTAMSDLGNFEIGEIVGREPLPGLGQRLTRVVAGVDERGAEPIVTPLIGGLEDRLHQVSPLRLVADAPRRLGDFARDQPALDQHLLENVDEDVEQRAGQRLRQRVLVLPAGRELRTA